MRLWLDSVLLSDLGQHLLDVELRVFVLGQAGGGFQQRKVRVAELEQLIRKEAEALEAGESSL